VHDPVHKAAGKALPPDLAEIEAYWLDLPEDTRQAILQLVRKAMANKE